MVACSTGVGNQLPCPGLFRLAKPSGELMRQKSMGCSPRGAPLLLPSLWELLFHAVAHPGVPCHAWAWCPSAFPDALGPVGACRLIRWCPMTKEMVAGPRWAPPQWRCPLRGCHWLWHIPQCVQGQNGESRAHAGKNEFWLFAQGSCLLSPVFSSATELFCNAGNFTCLLCASVFLITRRKIIQASLPRELRGFVNEHDKVLWDPWLKVH